MLYKFTSSYTQLQSIDFKRRELLLKEDAHKFKYYIPSQESDLTSTPSPSSYLKTETYTPVQPMSTIQANQLNPNLSSQPIPTPLPPPKEPSPLLRLSNTYPPTQTQNNDPPPPPEEDKPRDYSLEVRQLIADGLGRPIPTS